MLNLLRYGWRIHPLGLLVALGQGLITSLTPLGIAWLLGLLTGAIQGGDQQAAMVGLGAMIGLLALSAILDALQAPIFITLSGRVEADVLHRLAALYLGSARIDRLSEPDFTVAVHQARQRVWQIDQGLLSAGRLATSVIGVIAALVSIGVVYSWLAAGLLTLTLLAITGADLHTARRELTTWTGGTQLQKQAYYAFEVATGGAPKEVRLFGLVGWLVDRYRQRITAAFRPLWRARTIDVSIATLARLAQAALSVWFIADVVRSGLTGTTPLTTAATTIPLLLAGANLGQALYGAPMFSQAVEVLRDLEAAEKRWPPARDAAALAQTASMSSSARPDRPPRITLDNVSYRYPGGSHTELIARGGGYAELFELQAAAYREPSD